MSADLDREIDQAVRSMLDVEPSAAFRARVMTAVRTVAPRRRWMSWTLPLAAAALVVLIVSMPWRQPHIRTGTPDRDMRLPSPVTRVAGQPPATLTRPVRRTAPAARPRLHVRTAAPGEADAAGIDALAAPAPLSIGTLAAPASTTMPSIQPAPLRVNALDLPALEMPLDAARGDDR